MCWVNRINNQLPQQFILNVYYRCSAQCTLPYCPKCWSLRKCWVPYRKRKPSKHILTFKKIWALGINIHGHTSLKQIFYKSWIVSNERKIRKTAGKCKKDKDLNSTFTNNDKKSELCLFCNSMKIDTKIVHGKSFHEVK